MTARIVYSRGYPYGAPCLFLRGGATRLPEVKAAIKEAGARWDGQRHAWTAYAYAAEAAALLTDLRDRFGLEIVPSADLDADLIVDLPEEVTA